MATLNLVVSLHQFLSVFTLVLALYFGHISPSSKTKREGNAVIGSLCGIHGVEGSSRNASDEAMIKAYINRMNLLDLFRSLLELV